MGQRASSVFHPTMMRAKVLLRFVNGSWCDAIQDWQAMLYSCAKHSDYVPWCFWWQQVTWDVLCGQRLVGHGDNMVLGRGTSLRARWHLSHLVLKSFVNVLSPSLWCYPRFQHFKVSGFSVVRCLSKVFLSLIHSQHIHGRTSSFPGQRCWAPILLPFIK